MINHLYIDSLVVSNWKIFVRVQLMISRREGIAVCAVWIIFLKTTLEKMGTLISHLQPEEREVNGREGESHLIASGIVYIDRDVSLSFVDDQQRGAVESPTGEGEANKTQREEAKERDES
jgi:hypothetical protein